MSRKNAAGQLLHGSSDEVGCRGLEGGLLHESEPLMVLLYAARGLVVVAR